MEAQNEGMAWLQHEDKLERGRRAAHACIRGARHCVRARARMQIRACVLRAWQSGGPALARACVRVRIDVAGAGRRRRRRRWVARKGWMP